MEVHEPIELSLAKWISGLDGGTQGSSLVACLEVATATEGLTYCDRFFSKVTDEIKQLQTVKDVDDQQMANFFATYVRTLRKGLLRNRSPRIEWLEQATGYLGRFSAFCPHLYNNRKARYAKLEAFDIVLCLRLSVDVAKSTDDDENDEELCGAMEAECYTKLGRDAIPGTHWVTTGMVTVSFLLNIGVDGFFDTLAQTDDALLRSRRVQDRLDRHGATGRVQEAAPRDVAEAAPRANTEEWGAN